MVVECVAGNVAEAGVDAGGEVADHDRAGVFASPAREATHHEELAVVAE